MQGSTEAAESVRLAKEMLRAANSTKQTKGVRKLLCEIEIVLLHVCAGAGKG
jgi:hypothetical protein